jgi:hypothetical protein
VRRSAWLYRLQRPLLLWTGVVAVALSLLAMHQMSVNHTAADPKPPAVSSVSADRHAAGPAHSHAESAAVAHTPAGTVQVAAGDRSLTALEDSCPGCAEHHSMALTCLVALTLLAVAWLLRVPVRWPGLLARRPMRALLQTWRSRWIPPPLSLVELSISRT